MIRSTGGSLFVQKGVLSHQGIQRDLNEDSMAWREPDVAHDVLRKGYVYVVADGVATRQAGEVASHYATRRVGEHYYCSPTSDTGKALAESIKLVNEELLERASQEQGEEGMATTLLAAVVKGGKLFLANVGDCRAYLIRDQRIEQLTEDHSFAAELVRIGRISEEEAVSSTRNVASSPATLVPRRLLSRISSSGTFRLETS